MKQRILFWGSIVLAVGGVVCSAIYFNADGEPNIALVIIGLALLLLGIIGITFTRYGDQKAQQGKYEQECAQERADYESAKYLSVLYGGKKKRLGAPTPKDRFLVELYLTEDEETLRQYFAGTMPRERTDAFYKEHARLLCTIIPTLQELEQLSGKVVFIVRKEYDVMRVSETYRTFFSKNEIIPF